MIKARDRSRDELRKFYTFLKEEAGAEGVPSRSLGSKEECLKAIREIIKENKNTFLQNWKKAADKNMELAYEISELKIELEALKNKKWYQFWKR